MEKRDWMASERVFMYDENNFEQEVLNNETPVLVDFWAPWCGPCRAMAPIVDEIAELYNGRLCVGKVNVDDCEKIAFQYKIGSIPTLILFQNGEVKEKLIGLRGVDEVKKMVGTVVE